MIYEEEGMHYNASTLNAFVANNATIKILLMLYYVAPNNQVNDYLLDGSKSMVKKKNY